MSLKDIENIIKQVVNFIPSFHKFFSLLAILFLAFVFLFFGIHPIAVDRFDYEWHLYGFAFLGIFVFWLIYKYKWPYKKNKINPETKNPSKTGLVISIYADTWQGLKIKNLFIKELSRNINDSELDNYFEIIPVPNQHAENIKTRKDVDEVDKKINGHIYFYGDIQYEQDGKNKKYFLSIDGYVKHLPVPISLSKELSFDYRALLPKEINFDEFFGLRGCKATAKIVYLTTKYVAGVASFLSGNPFLAITMHEKLGDELKGYEEIDRDKRLKDFSKFDFKQIKNIKNKLPLIISNEAFSISKIYYENNLQDMAKEFLAKSLGFNQNNYNSYLLKAIIDFEVNNDPLEAMNSIKNAKRCGENRFEWKYSWAFLHFWFQRYGEAFKMCQKISKQNYPKEDDVVENVEQFNLNILNNRQDKPQLYFWIGYLSYKKMLNFPKALEYFEKFKELANINNDAMLFSKAGAYIAEIKNKMK